MVLILGQWGLFLYCGVCNLGILPKINSLSSHHLGNFQSTWSFNRHLVCMAYSGVLEFFIWGLFGVAPLPPSHLASPPPHRPTQRIPSPQTLHSRYLFVATTQALFYVIVAATQAKFPGSPVIWIKGLHGCAYMHCKH